MVVEGRGGYCFEHNLLLKHALDAIGFHVTGLAVRVLCKVPKGALTARSHMLLRIDLDAQTYIADAGFGGVTLTAPLRLKADSEQVTPHESFRLLKTDEEFIEQVNIRGDWASLYRFGLGENLLPDYEVSNWYLLNHPDSSFVTGLIAARAAPNRRYALRDNDLAVHHLNGGTERRVLTNAAEMRATLERDFRLTLPCAPELDAVLEIIRRVPDIRKLDQRVEETATAALDILETLSVGIEQAQQSASPSRNRWRQPYRTIPNRRPRSP